MSPEQRASRQREYEREYREANREKVNASARRYHEKNKDRFRVKRREYARIRREKNREIVQRCKSVPCTDCRLTFDPVCMDFDHLPGTTKRNHVASLVTQANSEILLAEIAKCEVVCSNCHRLRTKNRRLAKSL